jgi:hypothetical protein
VGHRAWRLALLACVALAPWALAGSRADPLNATITEDLTGTGGARMTAGTLILRASAGQVATGRSTAGAAALSHGVYAAPHTGGCVANGPSIVANIGDTVCLALPPGCPVSSFDPMYQWFREDDPNALVDLPGVITGTSTAELCIAAVTLNDSDVYQLLYDDDSNTSVQYNIELIVVSAVPASGLLSLATLAALLALVSMGLLSNKYRSTGR